MMATKRAGYFVFLVLLLLAQLLVACGDDSASPTKLAVLAPSPTVTPPFAAAPILTPTPTADLFAGTVVPTATPTTQPPTPIVVPTPTVPKETVVSADDLGITTWNDTQIIWSPDGTQYLLQVLGPNDPLSFYFLVRPPASVIASFKLSRTIFSTFAWSPDNRYLSYIQQDNDGNGGPVKLIDTRGAAYLPTELFRGPCSSANWISGTKLVATCGTTVLGITLDAAGKTQTESLVKLDEQGRLPGSPTALTLIARALPSPDGKTLAIFGVQATNTGKAPVGEIGFLDLATRKFSVLDRNDRPVAPVDWTPDSKNLVLRNLTGDWVVTYTYDFYLADPVKLKITTNLTKSNPKCDPVLGKADCQGNQASTYQTSRIVFAPEGTKYFVTGLRYVPRPNVGLQTAERLLVGNLSDGKISQVVEQPAGGKIVGLTWLPSGRYFYSYVPDAGGAKAFLDNKALTIGPNQPPLPTPVPVATATPTFAPTATLVPPTPTVTTTATTTAAGGSVSGLSLLNQATVVTTTAAPVSPTTSGPAIEPVRSPSPEPSDATITLTATSPATTTAPLPTPTLIAYPTPTPPPTATPAASGKKPLIFGFYASPTGNWVISVEKISEDKPVQFQLRLIPLGLK